MTSEEPGGENAGAAYVERSRVRFARRKRASLLWRSFSRIAASGALLAAAWGYFPLNVLFVYALLHTFWTARSDLRRLRYNLEAVCGGGERLKDDDCAEPTDQDLETQERLRASARELDTCYRRWESATFATFVGSAVLLLFLHPVVGSGAFWVAASGATLGGCVMRYLRIRGERAAREVEEILDHAEPGAIGAIIDYIQSSDGTLNYKAYGALTRLLPRVRSAQGHSVSAQHRKFLYRLLHPDFALSNRELAVAVMRLVEELGDPAAERYVLELAASVDPSSDFGRSIASAATMALESIGMADEHLGIRGTLLSPAFAPDSAGGTLLRAVRPHSQPREQLLRPAATDGTSQPE